MDGRLNPTTSRQENIASAAATAAGVEQSAPDYALLHWPSALTS